MPRRGVMGLGASGAKMARVRAADKPTQTRNSDAARRISRGKALRRAWPCADATWRLHCGVVQSWWPDLGMLLVVLAISGLLLWPSPAMTLDLAVRDWGQEHLEPVPYWIARGLKFLGQGTPLALICLGLSAWAAWTFRTIRPLVLFAAVYLLLGLMLPLKSWLDRVAPRYPDPDNPPYIDLDGAMLFSGAEAASYPSGHAANAAVWYVMIVLLVGAALTARQRKLLIVVPPLLVFASQTYLGYHWVTDTPSGYLLGLIIVRAIMRVPWETVRLPVPERLDRGVRYPPGVSSVVRA